MKRQPKAKGPRIVSRYDPAKIERHRHGRNQEEVDWAPMPMPGGENVLVQAPTSDQVAAQRTQPVKITEGHWLYRDYWVALEDESRYRLDDLLLLIKRAVLREERELLRARQEVESLERLGDLPLATREMIPDDVRMFVWQRDAGQCVRCGSREKLEFDHIIPVADGGSSTERNVQLLCEPCNRSKGRSVT